MNCGLRRKDSVCEISKDVARVVQKKTIKNENKNSERGKSSRRKATPKVYIFLSFSKNAASKPEYIQVPKERLIEILVHISGEGSTAKNSQRERTMKENSTTTPLSNAFSSASHKT